jgi:solute carrier family 25 thiamine pyrophosphate transporter 19
MLAGSFATASTYPFDLLRTRFAMQGTNKVKDGQASIKTRVY